MDCDPGDSSHKQFFPIIVGLFAIPFAMKAE